MSNAGGLGSLACGMLGPACKELAAIKTQTRKPYNVNFLCYPPPVPDEKRERSRRAAL